MANTLLLLRHAKSDWGDAGGGDFERGLNQRGRRDAPKMGAALAGLLAPQVIHASPARRAQLTLQGLCAGWTALADQPHYTEEDLYTFSGADLFEWIAAQDDACSALFVISHNPGLTDLVNALVGHDSLDNLPTAGYVELMLRIDHWRDLRQGCAMLEYSLFPKQLRDH